MARRALITGVRGQDGAYLAALLLQKGYEVTGSVRPGTAPDMARDRLHSLGIAGAVKVIDGDVTDLAAVCRIVEGEKPDEVYNLASHSFVPASWSQPLMTGSATALGVMNVLEAVRQVRPEAHVYQASSSEMFGLANAVRLSETSAFHPRSPYAAAKAYGHWMTVNYREGFGLHASSGILFNHESPLRGVEFVTRKITSGVAAIKRGRAKDLRLGNLYARRDWGHAIDYVRAMWLMLQQDKGDDFVIATGRTSTVEDVCRIAFGHAGLSMEDHVVTDVQYVRPTEFDAPQGDAAKARRLLGWEPKISLEQMIVEMVDADLKLLVQ